MTTCIAASQSHSPLADSQSIKKWWRPKEWLTWLVSVLSVPFSDYFDTAEWASEGHLAYKKTHSTYQQGFYFVDLA